MTWAAKIAVHDGLRVVEEELELFMPYLSMIANLRREMC